MKLKSLALAVLFLTLGFLAGRMTSPKTVKAAETHRIIEWHSSQSSIVTGEPTAISCPVEGTCYVVTGY